MSTSTSFLLRVRDRALLRECIASFVAAGNQFPTLWPLDDGSVIVGTSIDWNDVDMERELRGYLRELTSARLADLHEDPRGVLVLGDYALPRRKTYDGVIAEIGGYWVDPAAADAPKAESGIDPATLVEAVQTGDAGAVVAGLAKANEWLRGFVRHEWESRYPDRPLVLTELPPPPAPGEPPVRPIVQPTVARRMVAVAVLLPAAVAKLVDDGAVMQLESPRRIALDEGAAIYVTDWGGEAVIVATWLGAACVRAGVDRSFGACSFFAAPIAAELRGVTTVAAAEAILGDRVERLELLDWNERGQDNDAKARAWLAAIT